MSRQNDLVDFTAKLALFIRRGIPVDGIIENTVKDIKDSRLRVDFRNVAKELSSGKTFSQSLENLPGIYPKPVIKLIETGENKGELADTLDDVSEYLKTRGYFEGIIKNRFISFLLYINIVAILIIISFFFITPLYRKVVADMQYTLSFFCQVVLLITDFFQNHANKAFFLILLFYLNFVILIYNPVKSRFFYNLFITRSLMRKYYLFITLKLTSLFLKRGASLKEAIGIISEGIDMKPCCESLKGVSLKLEEGCSFFEAMKETNLCPDSCFEMVDKKENNGSMERTLDSLVNLCRCDLETQKCKVTRAVNAVFIAVILVIVIFSLLALYYPFYPMPYWKLQ